MAVSAISNPYFIPTRNLTMREAVDLALSCEHEEVLQAFEEVKTEYGLIRLEFSRDLKQDAMWKRFDATIAIRGKIEDKCRDNHDYVYYLAILIIFEMVNATNKEQFNQSRINGLGRRDYVFFREIAEWSGTLIKMTRISKDLFMNKNWPSICVHRYAPNPDIHYLWQQINGHADCYTQVWDQRYPRAQKVNVSTFPCPLSDRQKQLLELILESRIYELDDSLPEAQERARTDLAIYREMIESATYPGPKSWKLKDREEFSNFKLNALYALSSVERLQLNHKPLWDAYNASARALER